MFTRFILRAITFCRTWYLVHRKMYWELRVSEKLRCNWISILHYTYISKINILCLLNKIQVGLVDISISEQQKINMCSWDIRILQRLWCCIALNMLENTSRSRPVFVSAVFLFTFECEFANACKFFFVIPMALATRSWTYLKPLLQLSSDCLLIRLPS